MKLHTYKLENNQGVVLEFMNFGAKIIAVKIPDKNGFADIALGYDTPEEFLSGDGYVGAICGRFANRISNGGFTLNNQFVALEKNNGPNHLHGGNKGFHTQFWDVESTTVAGYVSAYKLSLLSPDGEENYPGNLRVSVIYALSDNNEFLIDILAESDKETVINLTSHPYFNLKGVGEHDVLDHELEINANEFTPLNENSVPTGEKRKVANTAMDFNAPVALKNRVSSDYEQVKLVGGLDHNWVLNKKNGDMDFAARVKDPESGRAIEVYTNQPGLQVYTAMHFDGTEKGKEGVAFKPYCAIAMEAQNFPDAPNKSNFPSAVLKPGEKYNRKIVYVFKY